MRPAALGVAGLLALLSGCVAPPGVATFHFAYLEIERAGERTDDDFAVCPARVPPPEPVVDGDHRTVVFLAPPANAGEYFQTDNLHGLVLVVSRTASPCPDLVTTVFPVYGSASEAEVWLESHSPRIGNAVCVDETACHDAERNMTVHLHEDGAVALGQEGAADVVIDAGESHSWTQRDEDANQTTTATYVLRAMGNWPAAGLSFPSDEETR